MFHLYVNKCEDSKVSLLESVILGKCTMLSQGLQH